MNEQNQQPRLIAPEEAATLNVFGVAVHVLLRGEHTGGVYSTYEAVVEPGAGPPPHVHHEDDEAFYVVEGEFDILQDDLVTRVGAGAFVYLPRLVPHRFTNAGTTPGRLLGIATPAGHERFFEDVDHISRNGMPAIEEALAVCRKHGIEILTPPPA